MEQISEKALAKGITTIFADNRRIAQKLGKYGNFPSSTYLRCLLVISLRTAAAMCMGDKSKAISLVSDTVNEIIADGLDDAQ